MKYGSNREWALIGVATIVGGELLYFLVFADDYGGPSVAGAFVALLLTMSLFIMGFLKAHGRPGEIPPARMKLIKYAAIFMILMMVVMICSAIVFGS